MTDELISVDPDRCNQAAGELEKLRDVLIANVPVITSILEEYWHSGVGRSESLGLLTKARHLAPGDAATMRTRARLAAIAASDPQALAYFIDGMVTIPGGAKIEDAQDARADVQALLQAEASGNKQAARVAIQAIQQDMQDHLDANDTRFLADFWSQPQAAAATTSVATALHNEDGSGTTVLTSNDKQILATFATSLATTTTLNKLSTKQDKQLLTAFTAASAKDPWSAGMLLASGPGGKAYGTGTGAQILGTVTASVLNAERAGTFTVPMNWQQLLGSDQATNGIQVEQALAHVDPTMALLKLDTSNGAAAAFALSTPDGQAIAHQLMTWQFMHYANMSEDERGGLTAFHDFTGPQGPWDHYQVDWSQQEIGSFLDAATAVPRGQSAQAKWAARAAVNVINGTPSPTGSGSVDVSSPVRQALLDTFGRYLPDLAGSLADPGAPPVYQADKSAPYLISVKSSQLDTFLRQICASKSDYTIIQGMAGSAIGTTAAWKIRGDLPPGVSNPTAAFSQLYGDISSQAAAIGINRAEQKDLHNQVLNVVIGMAESGFGVLPGGGVITDAQKLLSFTSPVIPQFSTDSASKAETAAQNELHTEEMMAMVPFIRGLEKAGVKLPVPPPPGSFDSKGVPTSTFFTWWRDTGAGEKIGGATLGDAPGGWVPSIQGEMGFGAGS